MWIAILAVIAAVIVIIFFYASSQEQKRKKLQAEYIERMEARVKEICPDAKIIVNNGTHLFFKDDGLEVFGKDGSGKTYSYAGLLSISTYNDGISLYHKDAIDLCIGKKYGGKQPSMPLDRFSVKMIEREMLPVLRKNLYAELEKNGITPTHEYVHDGEIWGCDVNAKMFYTTYGSPQVFAFSDLQKVTIEDMTNNTLCSASYIVHVNVKTSDDFDMDFDIYFDSKDSTFHDLLSMFKGIRNRR